MLKLLFPIFIVFLLMFGSFLFQPIKEEEASENTQTKQDLKTIDSLTYVNKVKDSIIYDLYHENKHLKALQ